MSLACEFIGVCSGFACTDFCEIPRAILGSLILCTMVSGGPALRGGVNLGCSALMGAPMVLAAVWLFATWATAVPGVPLGSPDDECTAASRAAACGRGVDVHDVLVFGDMAILLSPAVEVPLLRSKYCTQGCNKELQAK